MRRSLPARLAVVIVSSLLLAGTAAAAFAPADWRWRARIETAGRDGLLNVELPVSSPFWDSSRPDLADLRIGDEANEEVPYLLWRPEPVPARQTRAALLNVGRTTEAPSAAVATLDFGDQAPALSALLLEVRGPSRFMLPVVLHGSHDQRSWTELATPDHIYDLTVQNGDRSTRVRLSPAVQFRYIRATIPDDAADPVTIAGGSGESAAPKESVAFQEIYANKPTLSKVTGEKTTVHTIDLGAARPSRELSLTSSETNYYRSVTIEGSGDGQDWRRLGAGAVYQYDLQGRRGSSAPVRFDECVCRYLRVTIREGDDRPLPVASVRVAGVPARLLFEAKPGKRYWLYTGNRRAETPLYDISRWPVTPAEFGMVQPGAPEQNPLYTGSADQRPWTDRYPWILWTALGVTVALVGGAIFMMAKSMMAEKSGGN
jgi:hypothetical protein